MSSQTLDNLLELYPADVQSLARVARTFVLKVIPDAQETIDGSAPVIGYGYGTGYKGLICSLLLSKAGIKLGLAYGVHLPDPDHLLKGAGKVHRFVQIHAAGDLRKAGLRQLLKASRDAARTRLESKKAANKIGTHRDSSVAEDKATQ